MPRTSGTVVENSFVKGLITEATGLNFPDTAATETWNCVFNNTGSVTRRLGLQTEADFSFTSIDNHEHAINRYLWNAVAQTGTYTFLVVQTGPIVRFYEVGEGSLSDGLKSFEIDLDDHLSGGSPVTTVAASFAAGHGKLFIAHPQCEPLAVIYDADLDDIEVQTVLVQVRDFEGVDDGLAIDEQPATLSDAHKYNLYNQGWWDKQSTYSPATGYSTGKTYFPYNIWFEKYNKYPSNAMTWWTYKIPYTAAPTGEEYFRVDTADKIYLSNTPAPKGHYIYNAFNIDRSTVSGVAGLPTETSGFARPSCVAFYAGRVFYAGVASRKHSSKVYFSQIIERDEQLGYCYQQRDPTDEDAPDLLPNDGGVINIPEAATIIHMVPKGSVLFVFASNGVWQIAGSEGFGFRANDYSVTKVSDTPALSASSFVLVDGNPVWCNRTGIWTVVQSQAAAFEVRSLTDQTIKTFYQDIPDEQKKMITGSFNPKTRVVQWLYSDDDTLALTSYNKVLNFNTLSGAFYPWSIASDDTVLKGIVAVDGEAVSETTESVTVGGSVVTDDAEEVTVTSELSTAIATYMAYLIFVPGDGLTFAQEFNTALRDWEGTDSDTGVNYDSYIVSGYRLAGESDKKFQVEYVTVNYRNVPNGGAYIQNLWDYATSGNTGRWSSKQQIYKVDDINYTYKMRRLKIRGHGRVLQYRVTSIPGKQFNFSGWTTFITGNQTV